MIEFIKRWLCSRNLHAWRIVEVMKGGNGSDDSAASVACARCHVPGWKWCDGSYSVSAGARR